MGSNLSDAVLHRLHPTLGIALSVATVVERNNLVLQEAVDGSSIELVLLILVLIGALVGQSPSCTGAVAFIPPAVEHGEIDNTVHQSLLARCSGSLKRTGRGVHPDIHTADQTASQLHIVVIEEDNLADKLRAMADFVNLLNESLSGSVSGVCLTGEEELYGILRIVDNLGKTVKVAEEKVSTLVRSEAACKTNDESVGVNLVEQAYNACRIALILQPVVTETVANILHELVLQCHAGFPHLLVAHLIDVFPDALVALVLHVLRAEVLLMQCLPLVCAPSGIVYTVRHVAHVTLGRIEVIDILILSVRKDLVLACGLFRHVARPDGSKHALADLSVKPAHAIHLLTGLAEEG